MGNERIIVSTSYLPPIGYMLALFRARGVLIELHETYPKQTYRNHCCIYGPNGRQILTVPVNRIHGNHTKTMDVLIPHDSAWQKYHWRSIETAYSNSPFFLYYMDIFRPFFDRKYESLLELNMGVLSSVMDILQIPCRIVTTESYDKNPEGYRDLRKSLTAKHAILKSPPYTQTFAERQGFIPNLSIIDLIFNLGPEALEYLGKLTD